MTTAPFKADHVGSLLRPERIKQARSDFQSGTITYEQLREIETEEIKRIVDKQIEVGLEAVTDGEFRRRFWNKDFLKNLNRVDGYITRQCYQYKIVETSDYL